jgi:hypothetical protein
MLELEQGSVVLCCVVVYKKDSMRNGVGDCGSVLDVSFLFLDTVKCLFIHGLLAFSNLEVKDSFLS